jgi:hypothetical protein
MPVKHNRYIQSTGATESVNRTLEAKTQALTGWKIEAHLSVVFAAVAVSRGSSTKLGRAVWQQLRNDRRSELHTTSLQ